MIYSGRIPYGTNQVESSSLAITVENTDIAVFTTGSLLVSGSVTSLGGFTGSFSGSFTGSANLFSLTSSNALVTGNVVVLGTASINTLVVNQTQLSTGSNQLGDNADDFQTLYGTVRIPTGSLVVTGSVNITGSAGAITVGRATSTVGLVHIQKPANSTLANLYLATPYPSTTPTTILFQNNNFGGGDTGTGSINWDVTGTYFNISNRTLFGIGQTSIDLTPGSNMTLSRAGAGDLNFTFVQQGVASYVIRNVSGQKALAFITDGYTTTTAEAARFTANSNFLVGTTSDVARVVVKGSGTTSSTTALLVQNANASSSLVVLDNGTVGINTGSVSYNLDINGSAAVKMPSYNSTGFVVRNADGNADWQFYNNGNNPTNGRVMVQVPRWTSGTPIQISNSSRSNQVNSAIMIGGGVSNGDILNNKSIRIGANSQHLIGTGSIAIGTGNAQGDYSISISSEQYGIPVGSVPNDTSFLIGSSVEAATSANNQGVLNATSIFIGRPPRSSSFTGNTAQGIATTLAGMGGYGVADATGGNLTLGGGQGLGIGTPGDLIFATANTGSTGVVIQSLTERARFKANSGFLGIGTSSPSASLHVVGNTILSGSAGNASALTVYKSGSTVVSIQGSQGELFSITDSLSGSLFSVSNISGLPILEVFSDNTTLIGNYLDPMLVTTQLVTANSGSTTVYSLPTASYDGAFYDYVVRSGSNSRAGQIMAIWSGSSVNYTDNSTTDFGSTANLSFNVIVSGSNMVLRSTVTTGSWTVKTIIRSI